jgi:hypothetical protein
MSPVQSIFPCEIDERPHREAGSTRSSPGDARRGADESASVKRLMVSSRGRLSIRNLDHRARVFLRELAVEGRSAGGEARRRKRQVLGHEEGSRGEREQPLAAPAFRRVRPHQGEDDGER